LTRFGEQTDAEWEKAVNEIIADSKNLSDANFKGVILDVRNNPGGYLKGAVYIGSEFLKDGTVVIQQNANGSRENLNIDRTGKLLNVPLTVLINKGSASASEIVAGALHDRKRATLVGETSFGKGTIQQAMDLNQGAGIHITTAKWLTPNGTWVHGTGVKPDVTVENDIKQPDVDLQLEKAYTQLVK
jgi:carboxyl-terminal processing protease